MQSIYKVLLFTVLSTSSLIAGAASLDSLGTEESGGKVFIRHQVVKGETLYSLSRRYGAEVSGIVELNQIVDNQLSLGQVLRIPTSLKVKSTTPAVNTNTAVLKTNSSQTDNTHEVKPGETLFAISRKYGITVDQIKTMNGLQNNELSVGQIITIGSAEMKTSQTVSEVKIPAPEPVQQKPSGFSEYYVQSGELLESIAGRFSVHPDSIVKWNQLTNSYLTIGQKLLIKGKLDQVKLKQRETVEILPYGTRKLVKDQSGFTKIYEEGTASKIEEKIETTKYLALHRTLGPGTLIEVRNLMNNKKIFVRVVGKLPETGLNENVMIRLSPVCFERLGVIDPKTRVEVSYFQD
ncbi:MAG: LysM repeat protein [Marinoscillum sp.]|jgi:LysM repeat protein